jgi:hypothetical protein
VAAGSVDSPSTTLPHTGGPSPIMPAVVGAGLLYAGYVVILVARRGRLKARAAAMYSGGSRQ